MKRVAIGVFCVLAACSKHEEPVPDPAAASAAAPAAAPASATAAATATASANAVDASAVLAILPDAGLTSREQGELATALGYFNAPCASVATSVATCLVEKRACDECALAAKYLAVGVHEGWPSTYMQLAYASRFDPTKKIDLAEDGSPTKGPAKAPVTIVEFGSYLCPHCAAEAPKLDALLKARPKDVRLVFKPAWSPMNPVSERLTRAAIAAGAQGKFWEMHATLFANQPKFDPSDVDGYAKSLGLDVTKLHDDMASPATTERLAKDLAAAKQAHVDALPSIWINGRPFMTFEDLDERVAFEADAAKGTSAVAKKK